MDPDADANRGRRRRGNGAVQDAAVGIDGVPVKESGSPLTCIFHASSGEAYRLYLQGRFWWNRRDAASIKKALAYFAQATKRDPDFALAFSGLADAHCALAYFGIEDPKPHAERGREFALRAATLAPTQPEVHGSLGYASWMALDVRGCEAHYRTAAELGPHNPMALYYYGSVLGALGQHERALAYFSHALDIEPLLLPAITWRAMVLHLARRHEDSARQYRQALEVDPGLFRALVELAFPLIALRRWGEALETLERGESPYGEHPRILGLRGHILGSQGEKTAALAVLSRLAEIEKTGFVSGFDHALVWIGLGEFERAVVELERSFEQGYSWTLFAGSLPIFDSLHGDARYQALIFKLQVGPDGGQTLATR